MEYAVEYMGDREYAATNLSDTQMAKHLKRIQDEIDRYEYGVNLFYYYQGFGLGVRGMIDPRKRTASPLDAIGPH